MVVLKESKEKQLKENEEKSSVPVTVRRGEKQLHFENNLKAGISK